MIEGLIEQFAALDDPRLVIAVCAVVAEAETFEDIALYGRCKQAWLRGFLESCPAAFPRTTRSAAC